VYCPCTNAINRRRRCAILLAAALKDGRRVEDNKSAVASRSVPAIAPSTAVDLRVPGVSPPTAVDLRVPVSPSTAVDICVPVSNLNEFKSVSLTLSTAVPAISPIHVSPVSHIAAPEHASCLSPGPPYDGPPIDRDALPWPLRDCPDWPMNPDWLEFAFARVDLAPEPDDDILSFHEHNDSFQ